MTKPTAPKGLPDPATVERLVLSAVALSDCWLSAKTLRRRLNLTDEELLTALRDLVRSGDLDFDGVILAVEAARYYLPLREVSRRRRMEVVA